jgi:cytochrome c oxidase subunit IV
MARAHLGGLGYVLTWVALFVCTTASFGASQLHLPPAWDLVVALGIAALKTVLVLMFFMHLI